MIGLIGCQRHVFKLCKIISQLIAKGGWHSTIRKRVAPKSETMIDIVDAVIVFERFIETQFVKNPETDKHRYGHTHSQPANIDQ